MRRAQSQDGELLKRLRLTANPNASVFLRGSPEDTLSALAILPQPFETRHLGLNCVRIVSLVAENDNDLPATAREGLAAIAAEGVDFAAFRVDADDLSRLNAIRETGVAEVEQLVTFARTLEKQGSSLPPDISIAMAADADACAFIGQRCFQFDRFHQDARLPGAGADSLKAEWMRNAALGRADAVFVARQDNKIVGANACIRSGEDAAIDLIGVLPEAQRLGIGRRLVEAAICHYAGRSNRMLVGTQNTNIPSTALYASMGFKPVCTKLTFHIHLQDFL